MTASVRHDCVGALLVREGRVLLGLRSPTCTWLPGVWDVFGGHIEAGESAQAALARELMEELEVRPLAMRHFATLAAPGSDSWRLQVFRVDAWDGEPRNACPQEHERICWCTLAEAKQRLDAAHPQFPQLLERALAEEGVDTDRGGPRV